MVFFGGRCSYPRAEVEMKVRGEKSAPFSLIKRIARSLIKLSFLFLFICIVIIVYYLSNFCSACADFSKNSGLKELSRNTGAQCFYSKYESEIDISKRIGSPFSALTGEENNYIFESIKDVIGRCVPDDSDTDRSYDRPKADSMMIYAMNGGYDVRIIRKSYYKYFVLYGKNETILLGWSLF